MKKTLGVCIICKDEAEVIADCLNSVRGADEIVIVDTGSKDNTIEICKKYTKKVYTYLGCMDENGLMADFADARNKSISYCTTDFYIIIDCDEKLVEPIGRVKKVLNDYWFKYDGIQVEVKTAAETFISPRVLRNCKEIFYTGEAHNLPTWNGSTPELQAKLWPDPKHDYAKIPAQFHIDSGYSPAHAKDPNRTLRIVLNTLKKRPDDTRMMYYLSKEYMNRVQIPEAVEVLEKYRELKYPFPSRWDNELADALYLLALCYADEVVYGQSRWYDALQRANESWNVMPTSSDTATLLSELFASMPHDDPNMRGKQPLSNQFWSIIAKNSGNSNVLMRRNFK